MDKKRILILYAPFGVGHASAAQAIVEAFALKYPDVEIKNIDVLEFVPDVFKQGLSWAYNQSTTKVPILYKWVYNFYNDRKRAERLNNLSRIILKNSKFIEFIENFNPNFIISTNYLPMQLVSLTKEEKIINIPSANVCTDFGFHSLWHNKDVNYYFVATEEIKNSLVRYGVKRDKVQVTGIPTNLKLKDLIDREQIIADLKFDIAKPILLIVGGRISFTDLSGIVAGLKERNDQIQFIIVAGRDKVLQKNIEESDLSKDSSIKIFNFINNLDEYMSVADLILTKAGGLTVSECLVKNLPMMFTDIIPGQEEDNVNYIVKHGAGVKSKNLKKSIYVINELLSHKEKLQKMKDNCKKISKPNAAENLAGVVVAKMTK